MTAAHDSHPFPVSVNVEKLDRLTGREREVLRNLAKGKTNRVLAGQLGIAERTLRAHITSIVRKLDVGSRFEASLVAVQHHDTLADDAIAS